MKLWKHSKPSRHQRAVHPQACAHPLWAFRLLGEQGLRYHGTSDVSEPQSGQEHSGSRWVRLMGTVEQDVPGRSQKRRHKGLPCLH